MTIERAAELCNPFVVASKRLDDGTCTGISSVNGLVRKHFTVLILSAHEATEIVKERPSRPVNVYERANDDTSLDKIRQKLKRMNLRSKLLFIFSTTTPSSVLERTSGCVNLSMTHNLTGGY